jgi:uncharacterized protein (TIGR00251 family)
VTVTQSSRLKIRDGSVLFRVRLTPKGGRDSIEGWMTASDGSSHLKARVRVAPESGKANAALIGLIAKVAEVSRSAVTIESGEKARLKTVVVTGDTSVLAITLETLGTAK